ncbi:aminoacyl-tRNA hydrolase [Thiovibrio sp. JS02]
MYLLVGLGNPGKDYAATRHNIGFIFLDYLAAKYGFSFKGTKWQADAAKEQLWGKQLLLVKPLTYMNRSGAAVQAIANFHQVPVDRIIVVHDELDLPLGRTKIMVNRGAGGHNGIRSMIEQLGSKDFVRVRVGIGRPFSDEGISNFVLSRFSAEEQPLVQQELENIEEGVRLILEQGVASAMNRMNTER